MTGAVVAVPVQATTGLPDWAGVAPAGVLAATALLLLVVDALTDDPPTSVLAGLSTLGSLTALGAAAAVLAAGSGRTELVGGALVVDDLGLFFTLVFTGVTALVSVASYDYLADRGDRAEFLALVSFAAAGMSLMAAAASLGAAFVALELSSLPSYALVASVKRNQGSAEAGLKYFIVGALASAVFAFGISLVYAATGTLRFDAVASTMHGFSGLTGVLGLGVLFILGGVAFKTAAVPVHFWAPEAYEGAPAPVSAFLSSASKAAGFALAFRIFISAFPVDVFPAMGIDWVIAFQILAVATMTIGNFAAAVQEKVKRMLAYSSIGHAGYVLIGLAALSADGSNGNVVGAAMAHLLVYGLMNTGAFLFVGLAEHWEVGRTFDDYRGLARRAPVASAAMAVFMFSLAGLPPFGGFLSKYALFYAAVENGFTWLAAVGAVNSAISLFYYSRVVKALWMDDPVGALPDGPTPVGIYVAAIAAALGTLLLLPAFGPVVGTAEAAATALF